jgi:hypothetical protein
MRVKETVIDEATRVDHQLVAVDGHVNHIKGERLLDSDKD